MKLKTLALTSLTLLALAACGKQAETSVPADSAQSNTSAPAAPAALTEGVNYTVLSNPIPQQQAGKIEVLEFFGYFCPHCAHLEPVLSEHIKTFKDDTYMRREHVVWGDEMKPLARLAAAVEMAGESDKANSHIFDAMVNQKINLADTDTLKKWLSEQTAFDGKKVLAAFEAPESQARAAQMEELTNILQFPGTPTHCLGGKSHVDFQPLQSLLTTIDQLVDKVREEQKKPQ